MAALETRVPPSSCWLTSANVREFSHDKQQGIWNKLKWNSVSSLPHLRGGNDDILTICTRTGCEWAGNQLEMQPVAEIQILSFWEALEAHQASQLLDYLLSF